MKWAVQQTGKVPYGEDSRKYRRTIYRHEDWLSHRSPERLFGNLASTVSSGIVRSILTEVMVVGFVALLTVIWNTFGVVGFTDFSGVTHAPLFGTWSNILLLSLPAVPFSFSAPALGLLLVFRTNASYARWLEARMTWGRIISHSRSIVRQAAVWCVATGAERDEEMKRLTDSIWAYPRCLAAFLRGEEDEIVLWTELEDRLGKEGAKVYLSATPENRHIIALRELTATMDSLSIDEKKRVEMVSAVDGCHHGCNG